MTVDFYSFFLQKKTSKKRIFVSVFLFFALVFSVQASPGEEDDLTKIPPQVKNIVSSSLDLKNLVLAGTVSKG